MTDGTQFREPAWHEARLAVENKELRAKVERLKQRIEELEANAKRDPLDDLNQTLQGGV